MVAHQDDVEGVGLDLEKQAKFQTGSAFKIAVREFAYAGARMKMRIAPGGSQLIKSHADPAAALLIEVAQTAA